MARLPATPTRPSRGPWLTIGLCCPDGSSLTMASSETLNPSLPATYEFAAESAAPKEIGLRWESRGLPNLLRWTVLACCLPYPGDPKSAIDCFFLFGISLHPGVTGSVPHWTFRGCRVHSFPSPQELLRPASWLALLSRTFTFELVPTRSPSISVEYDYVDKQSIPTAGLSPASPTALWAAGHHPLPSKSDTILAPLVSDNALYRIPPPGQESSGEGGGRRPPKEGLRDGGR